MNNLKKFEEESLIENAKSLCVLYVESNKDIRHSLSNILNKYFEKVVSTPYADNAVKLFGSDFFDIVITDTELSDMSADIFCSKIKHIAPKKPIILISKKDDINKLIRLVNIGISGYIKTPFDKNNVISLLSKIVNEIIDLKMMYKYQDDLEINQNIKTEKKETKSQKKQKTQISDLLLTKRNEKISAHDFLERYPIALSNSINNILDINEDLDMIINNFIVNPSKENIDILSSKFETFSSVLERIQEFYDIAFVIKKLSIIFSEFEPYQDYKQYSEVFLALSSSISQWFEDIFINKTAKDIHFLDQSMLADALTLEDIFRGCDIDDSEGIEFF
jgi:DNA-binding response OmpR family regulator